MGVDLVTRNRTLAFVHFRSERRVGKCRTDASPFDRLLLEDGEKRDQFDVEMARASLPPLWVESAEDARSDLKSIKAALVKLRQAHQKRLLNVFSDDVHSDKNVEDLSAEMGRLVRHCESCIHQVRTQEGDQGAHDTDAAFRKNVQSNLATELQQLSQQIRQAQTDYLVANRRRQHGAACNDTSGNEDGSADLTKEQLLEVGNMEINACQRSEEICQIASSVNELNMIFKELAVLVIDQGTVLDRIDYNIEQVVKTSEKTNKVLDGIVKSQKSNRARKCMLWLVVVNAILILILVFKARH